MISVFVYKDSDDLAHWQWKAGAEYRNTLEDEPMPYGGDQVKGVAHVRVSPIPSIVLPWDNSVVDPFFKIIKQDGDGLDVSRVTAMKKFIVGIRDVLANCAELSKFKDDPLCIFIHFGGGDDDAYNVRLHEAWKGLGCEKEKFLCFAISRKGTRCINHVWREGDFLVLPESFKGEQGLEAVLKEGWRMWEDGNPLPPEFEKDGSVEAISSANGGSLADTPRETLKASGSACGQNCKGNNELNDGKNASGDGKGVRKSFFGCVLKWIVALELLCWSALSLWKCFNARSLKTELVFGVMGLVLLIIPVGVILAMHEDAEQTR